MRSHRISIKGRGGKMKSLKIRIARDGREYYVSGKTKKKHFLSKRKRSSKRHFGSKDSLINYMGNFQPPAQMSLAQSTTGFSAPQMRAHMKNIPQNLKSNFYV